MPACRGTTSCAGPRRACAGWAPTTWTYQVHEWDGQTPMDETLSELDSLVQSGKVRYIGASNYAVW